MVDHAGKGLRALLGEGNSIRSGNIDRAVVKFDPDIMRPPVEPEEKLMPVSVCTEILGLESEAEIEVIGTLIERGSAGIGEELVHLWVRRPIEGQGPDAAINGRPFGNLIVESVAGHFNKAAGPVGLGYGPAILRGKMTGRQCFRIKRDPGKMPGRVHHRCSQAEYEQAQ